MHFLHLAYSLLQAKNLGYQRLALFCRPTLTDRKEGEGRSEYVRIVCVRACVRVGVCVWVCSYRDLHTIVPYLGIWTRQEATMYSRSGHFGSLS